jgi:hypothetical protein
MSVYINFLSHRITLGKKGRVFPVQANCVSALITNHHEIMKSELYTSFSSCGTRIADGI